jgi:dihydrofolate reductase
MNAPAKYVVSKTQLVHALIEHELVDELYLSLYPLVLGGGKRAFPEGGLDRRFALVGATPYPTGVVGLHYVRQP